MTPETWLILLGLIAMFLRLEMTRNQTIVNRDQLLVDRGHVDVSKDANETAKDALIVSLASKYDTLQASVMASLQREIEAATREGQLNAEIAALKSSMQAKDEALEILKRMEPQLAPIKAGVQLANQQLTETQKKLSQASPDTQAQTDAAHAANVQKDYDSTQGRVDIVLPGAPAPATPTAPDDGAVLHSGDIVQVVAADASVPTEGTTP